MNYVSNYIQGKFKNIILIIIAAYILLIISIYYINKHFYDKQTQFAVQTNKLNY